MPGHAASLLAATLLPVLALTLLLLPSCPALGPKRMVKRRRSRYDNSNQ